MRLSHVVVFLALLVGIGTLSGCAFFDLIFGVSASGDSPTGTTPAGILGTILNFFVPGASAVVAAAGGAYARIRANDARKERESHEATIGAIIEAKENVQPDSGGINAQLLDQLISSYHKDAATTLLFDKIAAKVKAEAATPGA